MRASVLMKGGGGRAKGKASGRAVPERVRIGGEERAEMCMGKNYVTTAVRVKMRSRDLFDDVRFGDDEDERLGDRLTVLLGNFVVTFGSNPQQQ